MGGGRALRGEGVDTMPLDGTLTAIPPIYRIRYCAATNLQVSPGTRHDWPQVGAAHFAAVPCTHRQANMCHRVW